MVSHGRVPEGALERRLLLRMARRAQAVAFVSRYTADQMVAAGMRPRESWLILNGADDERFRRLPASETAAFRRRHDFDGRRIVVTVGNVTDRKGQDVIVRSLPEVLREVPDLLYVMAGLPSKRREIEQLAESLGVSDHVRFLGRVDDDSLLLLLNAADVFAMTSRHTRDEFEGFGIAVVEAALCGTPAVVSAESGLVETIVEGETGLGVAEDDPSATAEALLAVLCDEPRRRAMGEAAERRAAAELTWSRRAAEWDRRLRDLVDRNR